MGALMRTLVRAFAEGRADVRKATALWRLLLVGHSLDSVKTTRPRVFELQRLSHVATNIFQLLDLPFPKLLLESYYPGSRILSAIIRSIIIGIAHA